MALLPIKLRLRNREGKTANEVLCDTVKDAKERFQELSRRGFAVTAEANSGDEIDLSKLDT